MPHRLTLQAPLEDPIPVTALPAGVVRSASMSDAEELGTLYYEAYDPGRASASLEHAIADVRACFEGEYGPLWSEASPVAEIEGRIAAAVMTVHRAPWRDVPDCPFIIEVFTDRRHRRRGLARHLLLCSMETLGSQGEHAVALRVMSDNRPALRLYESLGFREWSEPGDRRVPFS